MIYRLEIDYNNLPSETFFSPQRSIPFKMDRRLSPSEYKQYFEDITPDGCSLCHVYKAPILAEWRMDVPLEVTLGGCDMPDVLVLNGITYVSEPAKTIIESHDPFGHQFWPIKVCDESGGLVTNKPYYHMNMRRYVTIESQEKPMLDTDFSVHPELEGKHIATIQQDDRVRAFVVSLPLWIHYYPPHSLGHALFMNEVMYKALCERGMKGIKQFTQYGGRQGELVAHV